MSSYFMFLNDRRKTVKDDHPNATMAQQTKIMTDEWKALTPQQRLKFDQMAAQDKQRYEKEKAALAQTAENNTAAMLLFGKDHRKKLEKSEPKLSEKQL